MNSILICRGMCLKGRVVITPLAHSLIIRIPSSASLMCSLAAVVLHSSLGTRSLIFSNSPSIRIVQIVNPARTYMWTTRSICLANHLAVLTGTCSAVINLICLDIHRESHAIHKEDICCQCYHIILLNQQMRYRHIIRHHMRWCSSDRFPPHAC